MRASFATLAAPCSAPFVSVLREFDGGASAPARGLEGCVDLPGDRTGGAVWPPGEVL